MSLDELVRQEVVFWRDKPTAKGWFTSWQLKMAADAIGKNGVVFYAMPYGVSTRFSDEEILRAERRLKMPPTRENREDVIKLLNRFDRGYGDADDVIDAYEDDPGY